MGLAPGWCRVAWVWALGDGGMGAKEHHGASSPRPSTIPMTTKKMDTKGAVGKPKSKPKATRKGAVAAKEATSKVVQKKPKTTKEATSKVVLKKPAAGKAKAKPEATTGKGSKSVGRKGGRRGLAPRLVGGGSGERGWRCLQCAGRWERQEGGG